MNSKEYTISRSKRNRMSLEGNKTESPILISKKRITEKMKEKMSMRKNTEKEVDLDRGREIRLSILLNRSDGISMRDVPYCHFNLESPPLYFNYQSIRKRNKFLLQSLAISSYWSLGKLDAENQPKFLDSSMNTFGILGTKTRR